MVQRCKLQCVLRCKNKNKKERAVRYEPKGETIMKRYFAVDAVGEAVVLFVDKNNKAVFINDAAFDEELTLEVAKKADYSNFEGFETAEEAAANYYTGENLMDFNEGDWEKLVEF